jgi:hypothetical protein
VLSDLPDQRRIGVPGQITAAKTAAARSFDSGSLRFRMTDLQDVQTPGRAGTPALLLQQAIGRRARPPVRFWYCDSVPPTDVFSPASGGCSGGANAPRSDRFVQLRATRSMQPCDTSNGLLRLSR